jgi:hypothetical protein
MRLEEMKLNKKDIERDLVIYTDHPVKPRKLNGTDT